MVHRVPNKEEHDQMVDENDTIIMSIKLRSGRFESLIEVPLYSDDQDKKNFIEQWLLMMEAGLKIGRANREARAKGVAHVVGT